MPSPATPVPTIPSDVSSPLRRSNPLIRSRCAWTCVDVRGRAWGGSRADWAAADHVALAVVATGTICTRAPAAWATVSDRASNNLPTLRLLQRLRTSRPWRQHGQRPCPLRPRRSATYGPRKARWQDRRRAGSGVARSGQVGRVGRVGRVERVGPEKSWGVAWRRIADTGMRTWHPWTPFLCRP